MTNHDDRPNPPSDWDAMMQAAVDQLITDADPRAFLAWMQETVPDRFAKALPPLDPRMLRQVVTQLAYVLAANVPVPGNKFRPMPLPPPRRNDPCPCGSGRKYKQCCAGLPAFPDFDSAALLPYVIGQLDAEQLRQAVRRGGIPQEAVTLIAVRELEEGRPQRAAELLEPLFSGPFERLDEQLGYALNVLCDCYDALDRPHEKQALLEAVGQRAKRPLQSEAWQRLATFQLDRGELQAAWASFRKAQRANPDDPGLAILEVTLLMSEGRKGEAAERAQFWRKRLGRLDAANERTLALLDALSADPEGGLTDAYLGVTAPGIDRLRAWLEANAKRPVPPYRVLTIDEADAVLARQDAALERARFGAADSDGPAEAGDAPPAQDAAPKPSAEAENDWESEAAATDQAEAEQRLLERVLIGPDELAEIEVRWLESFPGVRISPYQHEDEEAEDPWDPDALEEWMGFLEDQPSAFDSLDILDDLVSLVEAMPSAHAPWADAAVLRPMLERAAAIVERSLKPATEPFTLPWTILGNRPALRLWFRWALWLSLHDRPEALAVMERLLTLDPDDRQGVGAELMNHYLRVGEDERALALSADYGALGVPEFVYGRVLALYRLGRLGNAQEALAAAPDKHLARVVATYLLAPEIKRPGTAGDGSIIAEEAGWRYRSAMLATWQAVPGLLEWLARHRPDAA